MEKSFADFPHNTVPAHPVKTLAIAFKMTLIAPRKNKKTFTNSRK